MPGNDITLYGRVVSNFINIYFYNGSTLVEKRGLPMGVKFGEMPKVTGLAESQRLVGWYDKDGKAYDYSSTVRHTEDYFLYARIDKKLTPNLSAEDFEVQTRKYNGYMGPSIYSWGPTVQSKLKDVMNSEETRAAWRINGAPPEVEWKDVGSMLDEDHMAWPIEPIHAIKAKTTLFYAYSSV